MSVKLRNIIAEIERFAPPELKEDYDNVGLMVGDRDAEIQSILIALDCTDKVIEEAMEKGCNLIFTHHPIIFRKPASITEDSLIGRKLLKLIKNNINVYACHTNLDVVSKGVNDIIVELMGFESSTVITPSEKAEESRNGGIGRLVVLDSPTRLEELCKKVKNSLELENIRYSGEKEWPIKRVAIINGSGQDYFSAAKRLQANCIITGDTSYHYISDFYEEEIAVIDAGHFGTEWPAIKQFAITLQAMLAKLEYNVQIITSDKCTDPYKFI